MQRIGLSRDIPASDVEEDRFLLTLQVNVEDITRGAAGRDKRRDAMAMLDAQKQGIGGVRLGFIGKYIRVCNPILMPRATIQNVMCGAIGRPSLKGTGPGLIVSKRKTPSSAPVGHRPQPEKLGSAAPRISDGEL